MQVPADPIHVLRLVAINVDFVGDAEVPERLLQNEGLGLGPQTRRAMRPPPPPVDQLIP